MEPVSHCFVQASSTCMLATSLTFVLPTFIVNLCVSLTIANAIYALGLHHHVKAPDVNSLSFVNDVKRVLELLQKQTDIGTTPIRILNTTQQQKLVQIIDDGTGMTPDDATICFHKHATSKIQKTNNKSKNYRTPQNTKTPRKHIQNTF